MDPARTAMILLYIPYRLKGSEQRNSKPGVALVSSCFPQRYFGDHMHASVYLSKALLVGPDQRKRGGCCQMCSGRQMPRKPRMGFQGIIRKCEE